MMGDEIATEGSNIAKERAEAVICRSLGIAEPEPKEKGFPGGLFERQS